MKRIGVLALQGGFEAHVKALEAAGALVTEVRTAADLDGLDGLVIPGGESTTMLKLLHAENMVEPLRTFGARKPIFGTCAGAILVAAHVSNPVQESLGLVDIDVERNAYGRQLDSHVSRVVTSPELGGEEVEAVFIRAPKIRRLGDKAVVLATYKGDPVLIEEGRHLVATFHPELSADTRVHRRFLEKL
jgi:5'-phosphate synthase pdxT subunit